GSVASEKSIPVAAAPSHATTFGRIDEPPAFHFVKLELRGAGGTTISRNFYWRGKADHPDDLQALNDLPVVPLEIKVARHDSDGKCVLDVTVSNPTPQIALMAHLQLRRANSGQRVLPAYTSDNYFSLAPKESRRLTIEAASADLAGEPPLIAVDGWNIAVARTSDTSVALNEDAQVGHWPVTGLPIYYGPPMDSVRINCGGLATGGFAEEGHAHGGSTAASGNVVAATVPNAAPPAVYQSERWGEAKYLFPMKPPAPGHTYTVRLHFAETKFDQPGQRKFNVLLNGNPILKDFDVLAEAGGPNRAVVKEFPGIVPNEDGNVVIELKKGSADNPKLNAIEILPL
ncbi:MAG TPA: malectin domain-containing carbohydrate-binding protein, partial [Chthoniobacterales bacterium]|nr:malectin domain-containing carbohydrate-binding protein [Chthoniobacterales bacterium]